MTIAEAAEIVLKDAKAPMHARDIVAQIQAKNLYEFRTKDPASVVSKALRQSSQFKKTAPSTFTLRAFLSPSAG